MPAISQECSDPACSQPATFRTRTHPAWCEDHVTAILLAGGLEPLEPFTGSKAWRLTRCLLCRCEAHYRFEYTLDQNDFGQPTCRACFWRQWANSTRAIQGSFARRDALPEAQARAHAEEYGFDYLEALTNPSLPDDPHRVRCRYCGRISASRLGDIAFGCSCQTNSRRAAQTANVSGPRRKDLLKNSGLPVLDWWDHDRNGTAQWATVTVRARREAHWRCPDCDLRFAARINDMVSFRECPDCEPTRRAERQDELDRYKDVPVSDVPELLAAWADEADPSRVLVASDHQLRRFQCREGHHPRLTPWRFMVSGCPSCHGDATRSARLEAAMADPAAHGLNPEIASQWHPTRNGRIRLEKVSPGSRRKLWWSEPSCGHEWQQTPADREKGQRLRCPECRTILDSLGYHYPELAAEWSPENPLSAWQVRPSGQTAFTPVWVCANEPGHSWQATLSSRAAGSGCPECRESGKSKVELAHHAAAQRLFGNAASGRAVRSDAFSLRARWLVDIVADLPSGDQVAVEYDGAYWHADKADLDTEKTQDLLAAGFWVARLRENPLLPLPVTHDHYREFVVYSTAPDPEAAMEQVRTWALSTTL